MEERDFFDERTESRTHNLACPHCSQTNEYALQWLIRQRKARLPGRASEEDRARFGKFRSYMLRRDDVVGCKNIRCRKRFDVDGIQSVVFLEEAATGTVTVEDRAARIRAAFERRAR